MAEIVDVFVNGVECRPTTRALYAVTSTLWTHSTGTIGRFCSDWDDILPQDLTSSLVKGRPRLSIEAVSRCFFDDAISLLMFLYMLLSDLHTHG